MALPLSYALLLASLLLHLAGPATADEAFIQSVCHKSHHVDLCINTLKADPVGIVCPVKKCLASVAVSHAMGNATAARDQARTLLAMKPPQKQIQPLAQCGDLYESVITYLIHTSVFLQDDDYIDAQKGLVSAGSVAGHCEPSFSKHPSPLATFNQVFDEMLDLALELVGYLVNPGGGK